VVKYGTVEQATKDNITRRMRFACRITKTQIHALSIFNMIASPRQQWLRERASMLRYTVWSGLFFIILSLPPSQCQISTLKLLRTLVTVLTDGKRGTLQPLTRGGRQISLHHLGRCYQTVQGRAFRGFSSSFSPVTASLIRLTQRRTIFKSTVPSPYAPSKRS
jgi:hypothetical protein